MFYASILSHMALGAFCSLCFILYYISADGKWKVYLEMLIGVGGNGGSIFLLDKWFSIDDITIRMYSIAACIFSFLAMTVISLIVTSFIIKDKDDKDILRLRDILLGRTSWINKYYDKRAKEIDERLNIPMLEKRELAIIQKESALEEKEKYIIEEKEKIEKLGKSKLTLKLPEKTNIIITKDYIDEMPSYISDIFKCINDINNYTQLFLVKPKESIDLKMLKSYFISLSTCISNDIFGGKSTDVRIHFRVYNKETDGYDKLVAIIGETIVTKPMTFIPYSDDSMIKRSYECKRALIKSINVDHDYRSNNYTVWQDYMTYTFYNFKIQEKPYLSFGISVKNEARYKKLFHFLNFFKLEVYMQENIEKLNEYVSIENILYRG